MRKVHLEPEPAVDVVELRDVERRVDDDRVERVARLARVLLRLEVAAPQQDSVAVAACALPIQREHELASTICN